MRIFLGETHSFSRVAFGLVLVLVTGLTASTCAAQTASTGAVSGTVTDPSGAVVPAVQLVLTNTGTNRALTETTNAAGQYVFPDLSPGTYKLTAKKDGFRTENIDNLVVGVDKTLNMPVSLQVGTQSQTVEVSATGTVQLQTSDAQIGNTVSTNAILRLPTLQRNATELINIQPGAVAGGAGLVIRSAGAIDDQNTVTLDGMDITQNLVATGTAVPTPADSVQEFNVTTLTPNADLTRASGAQVTLIGRRGSNRFDGALYEYLQNSALNSNTWDNNRVGVKIAPIRDNRFGGRIGGPIRKDKTFFFANYEGRRFSAFSQVTRTVPTATLKQGIIQLVDSKGVTEQFNLKTAAVCGAAGNQPCDPRGLGISPSVAAQWALMPLPNSNTAGDGLNTSGYFFNLPTPVQTDYGVARLDHIFTDKLRIHADYTYFRSITVGSSDVGIVNGNPQSFVVTPDHGAVYAISADWQISPTWLNTARVGYVRDDVITQATSPTTAAGQLNIPGTSTADGPIALLIGSGVSSFMDSPIDMDTQRARYQAGYSGDLQIQDNMTRIWGKHTIQFGTQIDKIPFTHVRADKVVGSIASLVATVDGDQGNITIPGADTPLTCSATVTTGCITAANATNWARYYASTLGLVDNVNVLAVRDANLQPLPLGTFLMDHTNEWAPYFYVLDSWRVSRGLTLTLGLSYGFQTSPTEAHNLQTIMINASTGQEISAPSFMQQRLSAALAGQNYNPTIGFETVGASGQPVLNPDYHDLAPRASFAWSPSSSTPIIGKLAGDQKTVIRGGFSIVYDRSNTVQSVEIPMLGVGFDQTISVLAPACNITGPGGAGCNASAGTTNPGLSSFRVGVDGTLPLPTPSAATSPVIPATGYGETLSFQVDPNDKIGRSYNVDLGLQHELPGKIRLEAAFIGRYSRDLPQAVMLNQAPYMMVDPASNQSFAQAYDILADGLRNGTIVAGNPSTIPTEPFFEDMFPGLAKLHGASSATAYIVASNSASFIQGNVGTMFMNLASYRHAIGLTPLSNDQAQIEFMRTYIGESNYSGGIFTMEKRSKNLTVAANFTYSHYLDDYLSNQNNAGFYANSFHPGVDYGPDAGYDRHRVFNSYYIYELPFGKGQRFANGGNAVLNKIIGGWYTSGIVTAQSGLPLTVTESSQVFGGGTSTISVSEPMIPTGPEASANQNPYTASCTVTGTGTVGNTALTGSGLNIFSNPCATYSSFRYIQLSSDTRTGKGNPMRGFALYNFDASFGKDTKLTERTTLRFTADMFNVLNYHNYTTPGLSYTSPTSFGVITSTVTPANRTNSARWIEFGLRLEF
jgi:hypothetical protein